MLKPAILLLTCCLGFPAMAQDGRTARFAFVPVPEGTLRLDTTSGAVVLCKGRADTVTCQPVADREAELRAEVLGLSERVAALESRAVVASSPAPAAPGPFVRIVSLGDAAGNRLLVAVRRWKTMWN